MKTVDDHGKQGTFFYLLLLISSKVVTYGVLLVLANLFLLPDYGKAAFVMSIFRTGILFGSIGLPFVFVPWLIKKKDASSIFYFLLFFNLLLTGIGIIIGIQHPWIIPIVLTLPLIAVSNISNSILRVKHKYPLIQTLGVLLEVVALISIALLVKYEKTGIILGHAISFYVNALAFIFLTRKELWALAKNVSFNLQTIGDYLKKGTITTLLYLSFAFLNWIDSIVLGALSTFENVARYNVAGPVSNTLSVIPFALSMFLLTRESEVKNKKLSKSILHRSLRISFSFSFLAAIGLLSLIFPIIKLFFPKYIGVEQFVLILAPGMLFYSLYSLVYVYHTSKLEPYKAFWAIFLAAVINCVLDIVLIPYYGLYGITGATSVAHLFAFLVIGYQTKILKDYAGIFLMLAFLPLSYYLGILGILLLPFALVALYFLKLIEMRDIFTVTKTIFNIFEKFR